MRTSRLKKEEIEPEETKPHEKNHQRDDRGLQSGEICGRAPEKDHDAPEEEGQGDAPVEAPEVEEEEGEGPADLIAVLQKSMRKVKKNR